MWLKKDKKTSEKNTDVKKESFAFDSFIDSLWLAREQEFQYQNEKIQFRINKKEHLSLGKLLSTVFDIRKKELSSLNINAKMKLSVIDDREELWDYDIISPTIVIGEDGLVHFDNDAVLSVTYTDPNYVANKGTIIIHISGAGGISDKTAYFAVTAIFPTTLIERNLKGILPQAKCLSLLVAYDHQSAKEAEVEYLSLKNSINKKLNSDQYDNLTDTELNLLEQLQPNLGKDFAFGKVAMKQKTFLHAISYFERVYKELNKKYLIKRLSDEESEIFFEVSYLIGFCYVELELPEKALMYLEIATSFSDNIKYMQEYINCLSITKDIRTNFLIDTEGEKLFKKSKELWTNDDYSYYNFLLRRKSYVLIEMQQYDEAEKLLKMLLESDPDNSFIKTELAHIENIKMRK
jgi:tetratricopeptide (TPR) repeat protein